MNCFVQMKMKMNNHGNLQIQRQTFDNSEAKGRLAFCILRMHCINLSQSQHVMALLTDLFPGMLYLWNSDWYRNLFMEKYLSILEQ